MRDELFSLLYKKISKILEGPEDRLEKLQSICELLRKEIDYYDWVGFYLVNPKK